MVAHNEWISRGIAEGAFLLVGSLRPRAGGAILVHACTRPELEARINQDPFVVHDIVRAELLEVTGSKADPRLEFLLG